MWNPVKELKDRLSLQPRNHVHEAAGLWNPVKELKDRLSGIQHGHDTSCVESGEGIESNLLTIYMPFCITSVESGEGIESIKRLHLFCETDYAWNPVKELKEYYNYAFLYLSEPVESGEGIERVSPPRPSRARR